MRVPTSQHRVVILGRTGSGKSVFAAALLATRNFDKMPWIIFDYKGEDLIEDIIEACPSIKHIKPSDNPPKKAGLYYMKLTPKISDSEVEAFLWKVHSKGKCGLLFDEGYMVPEKGALDAILTQGRSLHIPVILLYQRPVWMTRFAIAQADFFAYFDQNDERDVKVASSFIKPVNTEMGKVSVYSNLPKYHCIWADVGEGKSYLLSPSPSPDDIVNMFRARLNRRKKWGIV